MASQIFNFPGFFDREIDLTSREQAPVGVPYGVIGAAEMGPAFVPVTVGSFADFNSRFGTLDPDNAATYAVERALANKTALTFIRILGAGANSTPDDIDTTRTQGTVKNAGFKVVGSDVVVATDVTKSVGSVQFLVAQHLLDSNETFGLPLFSDNNSYNLTSHASGSLVYLTRGMLFAASDTRIQVLDADEAATDASVNSADDVASVRSVPTFVEGGGEFKIVISSSAGTSFANDDNLAGVKVLTASLDPASDNYFAKLMNTDPTKFATEKHLVYADFAIDRQLAAVYSGSAGNASVALASGSLNTSSTSGDTSLAFEDAFGRFDTRYTTPKTPWVISQPFGEVEHNLFFFEAISDGAFANHEIKVSITNIQKSANPKNKYPTFTVLVRVYDDTDFEPRILEQFNNVTLDPDSENFIARVIGDKKARFNFDVENQDDRRLITTGQYPNRSRNIRVQMNPAVADKKIPAEAAPFGYRGVDVLNTNSLLKDSGSAGSLVRLAIDGVSPTGSQLPSSIVPPLPYTFKVTRGDIDTTAGKLVGAPGATEITDGRIYWGLKTTRNSNITNPNNVNLANNLVKGYAKFLGIAKLDTLVTGTASDAFNNNKFTLARVALGNGALTDVTSSAAVHMREAAYIRNGKPDSFDYTIVDDNLSSDRVTLATLYSKGTTAADFNKFSGFAKFTLPIVGGFDGTNILDKHAATFDDRSTSTDSRFSDGEIGNAAASFVSPGLSANVNGAGTENSTVNSYRVASEIITDSVASNINVLAIPGQRDPLVTDYAGDQVRDFGLAFYVMDLPTYDPSGERIWDGETSRHPDVENTANQFEGRALDNEFVGTYFPDVIIDDNVNNRRVTVPASVAAVGALGFNDRVAFPWFAPAGFNRAALDFVQRTRARLVQSERERLFDVHINPIVRFPRQGFVIFAQNTLELAESALGSINVVRMLNEVKRQIIEIGNRVIFDQADQATRDQLTVSFRNVLNTVAARQGIDRFDVVIDDTNNTQLDVENNRINARIVLVPTRAAEFIAIDFIITRSGVQFQ